MKLLVCNSLEAVPVLQLASGNDNPYLVQVEGQVQRYFSSAVCKLYTLAHWLRQATHILEAVVYIYYRSIGLTNI
jgi:hypothetical protein